MPTSIIPEFPRYIRLGLKVIPALERIKPRRPVDIRKISKVRVSYTGDGRVIYPEVFSDKWYPFVLNGKCLATRVRMMVGTFTAYRRKTLENEWLKWLKKWIKKNRYRIDVVDTREGRVVYTKPKKKVVPEKKVPEKIPEKDYTLGGLLEPISTDYFDNKP